MNLRSGPDVSHKRRRTGDVLRISNVQNISDAERGFLHAVHPKTARAVRGPKTKVRRVKRIESRRVHPGRMSLNFLTENRTQLHVTRRSGLRSCPLSRFSSSMKLQTGVQNALSRSSVIDWLFVSQWRLT